MTHRSALYQQSNLLPTQDPHNEPIAIVGIGCRFPGGANNPEKFWSLLCNGINAVTEIPADRIDLDSYYDPRPATPGKMMTRWGGFLENIDQFDAYFFGISPREAERLDPQQRLLLEVAWEALEDAGIVFDQVRGSHSGVFVGLWLNDFESRLFTNPKLTDFYMTTGSGRYSASGRLSYFLGMQGPSITVDTACSSSLVAIHLACQSLWLGECSMALAGGANIILRPHISIAYSQSKMMAPDGRCKFGDARADGYVRSEGAAMLVFQPLSQAMADKNPIYALIRGGAVNNDGQSSAFLTTPGQQGQEEMLRFAYRNAGIDPRRVQYIEAHGTGTRAGDPIELSALGAVVGAGRPVENPCLVGSVKTNLGHTEGAAGVAGLIKVALSLKNKLIPPSLHLETLNPNIPWDRLKLIIPTTLTPWPVTEEAIAGVSAFGIAGTNAHLVLSACSARDVQSSEDKTPRDYLLTLSAHSPEALGDLTKSYADFLLNEHAPALADVCYTANCRRTHHAERLAIIGKSHHELAEQLLAYLQQKSEAGSPVQNLKIDEQAKVVFVFPGQGAQWLGMGRELLEQHQSFRESLKHCDEVIRESAGWSVLQQLMLHEDSPLYRLNEISVIQPTLFAIEVALAAVWRSWGIEPAAVVGHSMGEVAAAYIAGALSLKDAVRVICNRSKLMQRTSGQGAMAVVGLTFDEAKEAILGYEDELSIAVHNSPRSVVLSGDPKALETVLDKLRSKEIFCRQVKVDVASHSQQMDPLRPEFVKSLAGLKPRTATVPFYSTVTEEISDGSALDSAYWGNNLRQPVQFSNMIQKLVEANHSVFIEMSPHPILLASIQEVSAEFGKCAYGFASLRRDQSELATMLGELGTLYSSGYRVDWSKHFPSGGSVVSLPTYPWQRERFWFEADAPENDTVRDDRSKPSAPNQRSKIATQQERLESEKLTELLYEVRWESAPQLQNEPVSRSGTWLVFSDQAGMGEALTEQFEKRGERYVLVGQGTRFGELEPDRFSIRPGQADDIGELIKTTLLGSSHPWRGIVHLWSMHAPPATELSAGLLEEFQLRNCGSLLHLIQQLSQIEFSERPRLWIVTQGTQPVLPRESAPLALGQAPVWGFGRVIAEEHPEFWGGLIDLESASDIASSARLLDQEIHSINQEDQLAFRGGQRFVARLVSIPKQEPSKGEATPHWRTDSSYLITGGLGGAGIRAARWMIEQGARRLILLGRTQLPPRAEWNLIPSDSTLGQKIKAIREIEALGASVHLATCDISDESQLKMFLDTFTSENWPPIRGVLHMAGTLEDRSLMELNLGTLKSVLLPKISGGWLLHKLLPEMEIFILFSSLNSVIPQPGQSNYAAANAFLDTLAHYRRQQKQAALSINWGTWHDVGLMGTTIGKRNAMRMAENGIKSFTASQGLDVLRMLMQRNSTQVVVASIDWSRLREARSHKRHWPFLSHPLKESTPKQAELTSKPQTSQNAALYASLLAVETEQRQRRLEEYLQSLVGKILRLAPHRIALDKPLGTFGLDSLMGIELRNQLEANLRLKLSATLVWNYPTIQQLAAYLTEKLGVPMESNSTNVEKTSSDDERPAQSKIGKLLADIDGLSDEEVMQSLLHGK